MQSSTRLLSAIGLTLCVPFASAEGEPLRRMSKTVLEDKIRGGWAGQAIGVSYAAPAAFQWLGRFI